MTTINAFIFAVVTIAILASATALAYHGTINGEAIVALYVSIMSGLGVAGVAHVAAGQGARSALATTTEDLLPPSPQPPTA